MSLSVSVGSGHDRVQSTVVLVCLSRRRADATTSLMAARELTGLSGTQTLCTSASARRVQQGLLSWLGPTPVGSFTLDGLDQLSVSGTGLGTSVTQQAVLLGRQGPTRRITPEVPLGPPQTITFVQAPPQVVVAVLTLITAAVTEPS